MRFQTRVHQVHTRIIFLSSQSLFKTPFQPNQIFGCAIWSSCKFTNFDQSSCLTLLRHHWSIESFDELSQRHDMRHVWRVICPRHAVNHPFLMHEILAFAAFHKAYQQPEKMQEYYTLGIHHQDGAIKIMRPKLQNVTPQEAPAIVATSTLLTLSVFASSGIEAKCQETTGTWSAIDNILNIFSLMQGMGSVLAVVHTHVLSSWLAPMFKDPSEVTPSQPMLQEVINHAPTLISFIQSKSDLPEMERNAYLSVIGHLESVLQLAMPARVDNRELRFLFFWPLHLEPNFLVWLRERRPGALVIIMYYATMLFAAESRYWFIDSWGHRLMKACHEQLDRSWLPAVQWPLSFLSQTSPWNLFSHKIMNERLPGFTSASTHEQEASTLPYTQQVPRTMIYRQYGSSPLAANEQRSVSSTAPHTKCTPSITSPPRSQHSTTSRTTYATTPSDEVG